MGRGRPRCPNEAGPGFRVLSPTRASVAFTPARQGTRPGTTGPSQLTHSDIPLIRGLVIMLLLFLAGGTTHRRRKVFGKLSEEPRRVGGAEEQHSPRVTNPVTLGQGETRLGTAPNG